jgi:hypothetical protein
MTTYLRIALVVVVAASIVGGLVLGASGSSDTTPPPPPEQARLDEDARRREAIALQDQARLDEDARELEAIAIREPDEHLVAQVVFAEPRDVRDVARVLAARDLEITGLTGALPAGGETWTAHFGVPEDAGQEDVPHLYAQSHTTFTERMMQQYAARIDCQPPPGYPRPLSAPRVVTELSPGEYPCAAEAMWPGIRASLADFQSQLDDIKRRGYPVFAVEVSGRAGDLVGLLSEPEVRGVALAGGTGWMPNPYYED